MNSLVQVLNSGLSISYDDNHYTTSAYIYIYIYIYILEEIKINVFDIIILDQVQNVKFLRFMWLGQPSYENAGYVARS